MPDEKNGGVLVINNNIDNLKEIIKDTKAKVITYGDEKSDYYYDNIKKSEIGTEFTVYKKIKENKNNLNNLDNLNDFDNKITLGKIETKLIGTHNAENITGAISLLMELGISFDLIKESLKTFSGAERRLEFKGRFNNIQYVNDYAHHPSEIKKSIEALNTIKTGKLYIVFQPHTYTRLKAFYNDFVDSLSMADKVMLIVNCKLSNRK